MHVHCAIAIAIFFTKTQRHRYAASNVCWPKATEAIPLSYVVSGAPVFLTTKCFKLTAEV